MINLRRKYTYKEVCEIIDTLDLNTSQSDLVDLVRGLGLKLSRSRIHQLRQAGMSFRAKKPEGIRGVALYSPREVYRIVLAVARRQHIKINPEDVDFAIEKLMAKNRRKIKVMIAKHGR